MESGMADDLHSLSDHDLLIRIALKVEDLAGNGRPGRMDKAEENIESLKLWRSMLFGAWILATAAAGIWAAVR